MYLNVKWSKVGLCQFRAGRDEVGTRSIFEMNQAKLPRKTEARTQVDLSNVTQMACAELGFQLESHYTGFRELSMIL